MNSFTYCVMLIVFCLLQIDETNARSYRKSNDTHKNLFPLSIIHINDFHARFDEMNILTGECKHVEDDPCIGGYARIVAVVKRLQQTRSNPIYFNAGDNFVGTIWYKIGRWNITSYFLNMHKADVMTVGNHEFDEGPLALVPFLDAIQSPLVLANVDLTEEPELQGKFLNSTVLIRNGRKVGIIGIIRSDIHTVAKTGKIKFLDEVDTVHSEAEKLKNQGIDIIVVLSHAGIDVDFEIAKRAGPNVDVIVSAHSHTFMYTGDNPPGPDKPMYDYPAVVQQKSGHNVLIVQASAFAKYVGDLTVYFDESGEPIRWIGQPIFLAADIQPDDHILSELKPWREMLKNYSTGTVFGVSELFLERDSCEHVECIIGDIITDAYLSIYRKSKNYTKPAVAFLQAGGIRGGLVKGSIRYEDLFGILPFQNNLSSYDLLGRHIWDALEYSAVAINQTDKHFDHMLQMSGMRIEVNVTQPEGHRIKSIEFLCEECSPLQYEPIDLEQSYRVISNDFLARGGDGYLMISDYKQNYEVSEQKDVDVLSEYITDIHRLQKVDRTDRIVIVS